MPKKGQIETEQKDAKPKGYASGIAAYTASLYARNLSPKTAINYGDDLDCFFGFLGHDDPQKITTADIYNFMLYLSRERKVSARTVARRLSAIKGFFAFAVKNGMTATNPARDISAPKTKATLPRFLSLDQSQKLLKAINPASAYYKRDFCILTLFLNCGLRLSELVGIDLSDIDDDHKKMTVIGKGQKSRVIYLNSACRNALSEYLLTRRFDGDALFVSRLNKRISIQAVQWLVNKHLAAAGLVGFSVHKLRHTAATLLYEQGVDIRTLKEILGHEQLNTTQIYTHVSSQKIASAMELNPLSKKIKEN